MVLLISCFSPISPSAGQHLVDPEYVEGVESHPNVELILPRGLDEVLVATNTTSLQRLGGQLLILIGHQMDAEWKVVHTSLLLAQVENSNLGVWNSPTETRFWVRLILTVPVTVRRKDKLANEGIN